MNRHIYFTEPTLALTLADEKVLQLGLFANLALDACIFAQGHCCQRDIDFASRFGLETVGCGPHVGHIMILVFSRCGGLDIEARFSFLTFVTSVAVGTNIG